jgi:hypothetical protein
MDRREPGCTRDLVVACFEALVRTGAPSLFSPFSVVVAILLCPYFANGQENVASIIQHSAEANERDWAAVPEFDNSERDRTKDGDKTYSVTMLEGSPYERLIAVNGKNLSGAKEKEEQQKYEKAVAERHHESADQRSRRIAKYQADRKRDHTLIQQMISAFDYRLVGKRKLDGFRVYVLKATPRRGYKPIDRDSEVLTGMEGTMWIDQKTFQWVKVEAHVIHPVRIEGFLAEVEPGTRFEVEKRPVAGDIWLASHYSMRANAKVLLLFPHRDQEDDSYFNYHKAAVPSTGSMIWQPQSTPLGEALFSLQKHRFEKSGFEVIPSHDRN